MAVTQAMIPLEGRLFCLLMDSEEDSVEVVHPDGFALDEERGMVDFFPSFYHERQVKGWIPLMVRRRQDTGALIGLMVEDVSSRFPGKWWRRRRRETVPQLVEMLLILAHDQLGGEQTEPMIAAPRRPSEIALVIPDLGTLEKVPIA